ncbi:hypothetical protein MIND_01258600 [Mycena indigotica]|uniref:Uncharacterized protein n=1 Tax=Mycena indigotica TaxID=2126181 RepID=A0A8H6S1F2_9AGAR|nr:uncharacterized protein MIND_01258600 [Mycena indigotica]KAF7291154.1 hypothetical protein MIND_01258600 [Mycena indigotica]
MHWRRNPSESPPTSPNPDQSIQNRNGKEEITIRVENRPVIRRGAGKRSKSYTDAYRAKRALCRILHEKGWSASDITRETGITGGTVYPALKNALELVRMVDGKPVRRTQLDRDDVTQDEKLVDKGLLAFLTANNVNTSRVTNECADASSESEQDQSEPDSAPNPAIAKNPTNRTLTASDRALCRILHRRYWSYEQIARAFGYRRPGSTSPVYRAVNYYPSTDDISQDENIVSRARLRELIAREVLHPPVGKGPRVHYVNKSQANTLRHSPHGISASPSPEAQYPEERTGVTSQAFRQVPGPSSTYPIQTHYYTHYNARNPHDRGAHTIDYSLREFLANIRPEIDLSSHLALFLYRGVDTIVKLRAMKNWEDADLREALKDWFQIGHWRQGLAGFVPLSDYELLALRQAIRKL